MRTGKNSATPPDAGTESTVSLHPAVPWLAMTLLLGVAAVVIGVVRLDELPDPYPVHFGFLGDADRFEDRSLVSVLMPVIAGQVCALAVFASLLLIRSQGHVRVVTPMAALAGVVGGGISLISIAQYLSDDAVPPPWAFWALLAGIIISTIWVVVASVRAERESSDDREGWKLGGLVYANPDDPEVFVPKRTGVGTTVNFGRPMGWVVMALILLPTGIIIYVAATWG